MELIYQKTMEYISFSSWKKRKNFAIFSYLVGFYQSVKRTSLFRPEMAYIFGMAAWASSTPHSQTHTLTHTHSQMRQAPMSIFVAHMQFNEVFVEHWENQVGQIL